MYPWAATPVISEEGQRSKVRGDRCSPVGNHAWGGGGGGGGADGLHAQPPRIALRAQIGCMV